MSAWIFVVVLAAAAARPSETQACSCMPQTEQEALASATAVFEGDVASLTVRESDRHGIVGLVVRNAIKGVKKDAVVTIDAGAQASAMCGFFFTKGKRYIVYAYGPANALTTSKCTPTREAGTSASPGGRRY